MGAQQRVHGSSARGRSRHGAPHLLTRGRRFKVLAWVLLAYVCVAALHGAAPQLWARYTAVGCENGPFRLLMFSPLIVVCLLLMLVHGVELQHVAPLSFLSPEGRRIWSARSLRGPPMCV